MLTRMYLYSTSTKLSIDVWLYLDRPGSLTKGPVTLRVTISYGGLRQVIASERK